MDVTQSSGVRRMARVALPLIAVIALGAGGGPAAAAPGDGFQGENATPQDLDARAGARSPSSRQRALVKDQGARAKWNRFGTPRSLTRTGRYLATGLPTDPVAAARTWIAENSDLLGLTGAATDNLELLAAAPIGAGRAVLLRQRFDGLEAGHDGQIVVGVRRGKVAYVTSSLARSTNLSGEQRLSAADAVRAAAAEAGIDAGTLTGERTSDGWTVFDADSLTHPARARLVAVPTPTDGVRRAWETSLIDNGGEPAGFASFVDAETGEVLIRESLVDYLADNPTWKVFPNAPPLDYSSTDTRNVWCWLAGPAGCSLVLENNASLAWDLDASTGLPTATTLGNNARAFHNWSSNKPVHRRHRAGDAAARPRLRV